MQQYAVWFMLPYLFIYFILPFNTYHMIRTDQFPTLPRWREVVVPICEYFVN